MQNTIDREVLNNIHRRHPVHNSLIGKNNSESCYYTDYIKVVPPSPQPTQFCF